MTGNTEIVARLSFRIADALAQDAAVCCRLNKRGIFALSECWVVDYLLTGEQSLGPDQLSREMPQGQSHAAS
jgi:hypothetical protein